MPENGQIPNQNPKPWQKTLGIATTWVKRLSKAGCTVAGSFLGLLWKIIRFLFIIPRGTAWYFRVLWRLGNILLIIALLLVMVDVNFLWMFGKSPRIKQIFHPRLKVTSELYSGDGVLLASYYDENRIPMAYQEIPTLFIRSLIATEDNRFYSHHGIDPRATLSVFWYMAKGEKRGGSTITQQLVKNLFKTRGQYSRGPLSRIPGLKILIYKTKEWIAAVKIEWLYPKDRILTMYCNTIDFGNNAYGLKTACKTYFNKTPAELSPEEAALLIGMLKAPSYYSPIAHPERARDRRNTVLSVMGRSGIIEAEVTDSLLDLPLKLNFQAGRGNDQDNNFIREAVSVSLKSWLKKTGHDLYEDGLKIWCAIDSRLQNLAEEAVATHMKRLQRRFDQHWEGQNPWSDRKGVEIPGYIEGIAENTRYYRNLKRRFPDQPDSVAFYLNLPRPMTVFSWKGERDTLFSLMDSIRYYNRFLHAGFVGMDPRSGLVKCWVGDIDPHYFKFDHVRQSRRQPGSTFKAFVYAAAFDRGYGPCDRKTDQAVTWTYQEKGQTKTWTPRNADAVFTGREVTLKHAFARSINSVAVQLTREMGWRTVIEYAHKMGIKTELQDVPSVCLGSSDVSLYELVNAFCPMVNGGFRVEPVLVTRIEDPHGRVLYQSPAEKEQVLGAETAFYLQQLLLAGLTEPGGTTQNLFEHDLFRFNTDFGGKTGTSSNHSDGWFLGVTPGLVAGAWVGGQSRSIHFKTSELGEGCKTALPIYGLFMEKVVSDDRFRDLCGRFKKPGIKITKEYTCHTILPPDTLEPDTTLLQEESILPEKE